MGKISQLTKETLKKIFSVSLINFLTGLVERYGGSIGGI